MPTFGILTSGPRAGEITIQIKTVASGVDRVDHRFRFVITPVLGSMTQTEQQFDFFNYRSGEFVSILVGGLEKGRSYTFSATATNIFGTSDQTSSPQFAGIHVHTGTCMSVYMQSRVCNVDCNKKIPLCVLIR